MKVYFKMTAYLKISNELIQFLLNSNRVPYFREYTDVSVGKSFGNIMIEDLGDSLPFIFWAGKKLDNRYCNIADKTAKFLINNFQHEGGFFRTSKKMKFLKTYNFDKMTDLSLGINLMYALTKDDFYLKASEKFFSALGDFASKRDGFIPLIHFKNLNLGLNFSTGKFGLYVEELCNLYNFTNDIRYLQSANNIIKPWIKSDFYKDNGLFPFLFQPKILKSLANIPFKRKFGFSIDSAMSSKANTNLVYGLNAIYKVTKDSDLYSILERWYSAVNDKLLDKDGSLYSVWDDGGYSKFLGCDHAVIDTFLEFYFNTKEKRFLNDAEKMANFWIKQQDNSGLIQQGVDEFNVCADPNMKYGDKPKYFRLDPQVDFSVVMMKLYQLTENEIYMKKAKKLIDGICKYHIFKSAFVDILDENKNKKSYIIETKFLFLILKALMFEEYNNNGRIYKDNTIRLLLRDR